MIYDCFTYFDEAEMLGLRLQMLQHIVDVFVVVESHWTFSGKQKMCNANSAVQSLSLGKYIENKIRLICIADGPLWSKTAKANWEREEYQRNSILRGLNTVSPKDIVLISDVDEIPDPGAIKFLRDNYFKDPQIKKQNDACINLQMPTFYYRADNLMCGRNKRPVMWDKPKAMLGSHLGLPDTIRNNSIAYKTMLNAGWHFSYMGGAQAIVNKIASFSHQEHNRPQLISKINGGLDHSKDLFARKYTFRHYDWGSLPSELFGSKSRMHYFGLNIE